MSDQRLHFEALSISKTIHQNSIRLVEILHVIDERKIYADFGHHSLFYYIVKELGFSEAQASVYNKIVRSSIFANPVTKESASEMSLGALNLITTHINENQDCFKKDEQKVQLLKEMKGKTQNEIKQELGPQKEKIIIKGRSVFLDAKLLRELELIQKDLDGERDIVDVIQLLVNEKLSHKKEIKPTNKTITFKTRKILLHQAKGRCQHPGCVATKNLEVEHALPRGKGGDNNPQNLKILCKAHNLRQGVLEFGVNAMKLRRPK